MGEYAIGVIPGDGIGKEVIAEGLKVLNAVAEADGRLKLEFESHPWGCEYYMKEGEMMPRDGLEILGQYDAIYLGAVGHPKVPDYVSLWGLLLPIRRAFDLYANVRPVKLLKGVPSPLKDKGAGDIDFVVVRENTEGEYAGAGGRVHVGSPFEVAVQVDVFTRTGAERIMRYAFELALKRKKKLRVVSATKSNALNYSMVFWDEVFRSVAMDFPRVSASQMHVDAMAAAFVNRPETLDVVVASNLFGDILSDLGAAIVGGLGVAPSANIDPSRRHPSMFEPVHGSAPDIAGKGIANPIAAILSAGMMLDFLGEGEASALISRAVESTLEGGTKTPDLGGQCSTSQVGDAVSRKISEFSKL
ncbi:MAG: tartrate dehydrogenase [bacterium]